MAIQQPDFTYWNQVGDDFLQNDADNPARTYVAGVVLEYLADHQRRSIGMIEVGPGMGFDYERAFDFDGDVPYGCRFHYCMIEGSSGLVERLRRKFPQADVKLGTFTDLQPMDCKIIYAKAVFEHQPELREPLLAFLCCATDMAIITWYRPPKEEGNTELTLSHDGCYYATWRKADVLAVAHEAGWKDEELRIVKIGTNEVWFWRRK